MHKIDVLPQKKVLIVSISGFLNSDEAGKALQELEAAIDNINPAEYSLIFAPHEIKVASFMVLNSAQKFLKLCSDTPFKKLFLAQAEHSIEQKQALRFVSSDFYSRVIMAESVEEALKRL